jgi:hypothetical protein
MIWWTTKATIATWFGLVMFMAILDISLTGWLTRILTLHWLFVIAIFVFMLTSVGCAFSGTSGLSLLSASFRVLREER